MSDMVTRFHSDFGRVHSHEAWDVTEIKAAVESLLQEFGDRQPEDLAARVVINPNLNNDQVALVGNSTDLRVIAALVEGLLNRGHTNLLVADGSNVGVDRRGIDGFSRLRVDRLAEHYGIQTSNLNEAEGLPLPLYSGAMPRVARVVLEADCLISVPTVKTHVEAVLSCAMKNWVGIVRGQDKRQIHYSLARNIHGLNEAVAPDLVIVDGVIGMEGNGPGDGEPFRLGRILGGDSAFLVDLAVCRMLGIHWETVPYLRCASESGHIDGPMVSGVQEAFDRVYAVELAPVRSRLAELAEARSLRWLKRAVQPLLGEGMLLESAYRLGVVQDVYALGDDTVSGVKRAEKDCGECARCAEFCPTGLSPEEIGVKTDLEHCIGCLYCWWVCPDGTITLDGELGHLERQVERYKKTVEEI